MSVAPNLPTSDQDLAAPGAAPFAAPVGAVRLPFVTLCGPIAKEGEPARGGFQSCNRRTIDALRARGLTVQVFEYPQPEFGGLRKLMAYAGGFSRLLWRAARLPRGSILHMTGLYGPFILPEVLLIHLARLRGCACIYDLRAGSGQLHFEQRGPFYRRAFAHAMRAATMVMVEGERLQPFVQSLTAYSPYLFPNHLDARALQPDTLQRCETDRLTIAYAGTLKSEKGLDVVLEAARVLSARGIPVRLQIAGTGLADYVDGLAAKFSDLDVRWLGAVPASEVLATFFQAHFFVFPTRHRGEGQSNALTEAMACGCVPVASDHGFNRSVVGDCGAVLAPGSRAVDYADAVQAIWESRRWAVLSAAARQRICDRYDSSVVVDDLVAQYQRLAASAGLASLRALS